MLNGCCAEPLVNKKIGIISMNSRSEETRRGVCVQGIALLAIGMILLSAPMARSQGGGPGQAPKNNKCCIPAIIGLAPESCGGCSSAPIVCSGNWCEVEISPYMCVSVQNKNCVADQGNGKNVTCYDCVSPAVDCSPPNPGYQHCSGAVSGMTHLNFVDCSGSSCR